jgi:hypothetical protein
MIPLEGRDIGQETRINCEHQNARLERLVRPLAELSLGWESTVLNAKVSRVKCFVHQWRGCSRGWCITRVEYVCCRGVAQCSRYWDGLEQRNYSSVAIN